MENLFGIAIGDNHVEKKLPQLQQQPNPKSQPNPKTNPKKQLPTNLCTQNTYNNNQTKNTENTTN